MILSNLIKPACLFVLVCTTLTGSGQPDHTGGSPVKTINIGLLIQDRNSISARYGAELAIKKANATGGLHGVPLNLEVLSMEGPWGTGSKQAVDLIFEKNAVALSGSCDGRNAHLIEQASAKTRVVFISAWSGDPTLAQAYVPWFYSCVPNYTQQADALIKAVCSPGNIKKLVVLADSSYDSKLALETFRKELKVSGIMGPESISYENVSGNPSIIAENIVKQNADGLLLFTGSSLSVRIVKLLKDKNPSINLFGGSNIMKDREFSDNEWKSFEGAVILSSCHWLSDEGKKFREEFLKTYGFLPGPEAAYSFDSMNLIIDALRNAGQTREQMQEYFKTLVYKGITGVIRFDDKGKRTGEPLMIKVRNGSPVQADK